MRNLFILLVSFLLAVLSGCSHGNDATAQAMDLRAKLLSADGYSFDTEITADFGDKVYTFAMNCQADNGGNVTFTVTFPQTIAGISGEIDSNGGKLTFDDVALTFDLLANGRFSPVSAPWVLMKTLRSGYLTSAGMDGDCLQMTIHDSYEEDALRLDIWLGKDDLPRTADVLHEGRRILSLDIKDFVLS